MRIAWRTFGLVAAVAIVGAAGTLVAAHFAGMGIWHLLSLLAPAAVVTLLVAAACGPLLAKASLRQRFVAVALIAATSALANIAVLTREMFVSDHDALLVAVLLLYALGAGIAAALVLARSSQAAIARLDKTAEALGDGNLDARVGAIEAGPELDTLARTLDEMAERLHAATEREREIEATRRDLITAVSHDLRTPLASLRAMVEALDDGVVADAPTVERYVGEMRRSVGQLVTMVDDLFELVQLDAGAIETETRRVALEDAVVSAMATVEPAAREKGLQLETDIAPARGVTCSPRLTRALQNLLSNAVRHTPADGTVRVQARRNGEGLELTVEDTGEGIAPEELPKIFDPFYRGDPARSVPGSGLGLTLAKRIVEGLGGRISAQSSGASGARFSIAVPI
jgi:signal transduction histidine kinase